MPTPSPIARLLLPSAGIVLAALGALGACNRSDSGPGTAASGSAQPKTPDRLTPGELAESNVALFGLRLPKGMKLEARFATSAHAKGPISPEQLSNYVKKRVEVRHVELAASRTVFPNARITGGDPSQLYRIEVIPKGRITKLSLELVNPPKPPAEKGLSEAERWQRAGLSPDGKQLNPKELE